LSGNLIADYREQHPSKGIDLTDLPPVSELRQMKSKKLIKLFNKAKEKFLYMTQTFKIASASPVPLN
jgi:hypothetical protein